MPLAPGTRLGPYEVQSLLGAGGMGEVYRARDTKLKRDVALKILPEVFARDPERMARFQREAEVLASLNHSNIAHIYGVEERALVMELVEGDSPEGPLGFDEAWKIASQIADALEYAHEKGIVHRDLKPDNVKVSPEGAVKLLDFGLAKAFIESREAGGDPENSPTVTVGATVAGTVMGTPAYMAPEQAKGKRVDKRADIWSWGVMLYELLTGVRTFKGESLADTLAQVLTAQPDLEKAPPQARRLLRRCLEKDPRQRLRDIGDARDLLDEPGTAPLQSRLGSQSRLGTLGWVAAGVLALIAAAAVWAPWRGNSRAAAPVARLSMDIAPAEMLGPAPFFGRPVYTSMALSPDGNTLVFAASRGHQLQLYKRSLDQSDAAAIPGTEGAAEPFLSPDGQWVGFFAGGKLKKVAMNGGPATDICDAADARSLTWGGSFGASWTSKGTIVFAMGRGGIMEVPAAGGAPQTIVKPDPAKSGDSYRTPQFLPDGKTLLFTLLPSGSWDAVQIFARRMDTGEQRSLIKGGADARYVPTKHLIYIQQSVLMAVPFDAQRNQLTGSPVAMLDGVMQALYVPNGAVDTGMAQFATSASGHLIYASGGISPAYVYSMVRVDRKGVVQDLKAPKDKYLGGRVSPDGRKIAVVKVGATVDVWLVDLDSGNSTRLTSDGGSWPLWSPDGKRVLFLRPSQFAAVAADGSGAVEPIMTVKTATYPASWSADGKSLAYLESLPQDAINRIWTKPMPGPGEPNKLIESKFALRDAEFSPDGRWMVYTSNESGAVEVYVQAFPGPGEKHKISTAGGVNPAWARSGRELFYLEPRPSGKLAMMAVDFAAGGAFKPSTPHALFEGDWESTTPLRSYDVTPDGQHFIMFRTEPPPDERVTKLNVVLNWFEELNKRAPASGH
jgi:Tol biopolymer transport system component/predicted Ser/Thr protein kinase